MLVSTQSSGEKKRRKQFELMVALMVLDGIKWLVFQPAVKAKIMGHPQSL